ncbi:MAG: SHOCT domain-containing protein [Deltaproteobacteria bacterium]|nr:SHOCT domain-containing protein [Deltaproteobacteria bacterium]
MWLILIIVAVVIIYFVLNRSKNREILDDSIKESPTDILKKRYAKGDITKEEFEKIKRDLDA